MSKKNKQSAVLEDETQLRSGERLRRAREANGLSIEDVSTRLKLSVEKINALEQGNIEGLAAPVFVAGYVRTYARLLELPETELLAEFELQVSEPVDNTALTADENVYGKVAGKISNQFSLRERPSENYHGLVVVVAILIVGLVYFLWPVSTGTQVETEKVARSADRAEVVDEQSGESFVNNGMTTAETLPEETSAAGDAVEEPEVMEATGTPLEAMAVGMKSELTLVFTSDSWAEVTDAREQRLVYRLGKAGSARTVTGVSPFKVQLGFVEGVSILYNGENYDLSKFAGRRSVRLRIGEAGDRMGGE